MPDAPRTTPSEIKQDGPGALAILWGDGARSVFPVRDLRLACACAHCVDEWSGEPRLDEASVPEDIQPKRIQSVGRYAIQIRWTDGHETGIYSFERLRKLGDQLAAARDAN
jgi:ATP-binding protein involved in chromosome partitioning